MDLNNIYTGDCIELIQDLEDDSIDLMITSPPYNVDLGNTKKCKQTCYDVYNDNKEHHQYISWLRDIFGDLYPKIKTGGRVVINIGDGKNGAVPTHSDITHFMTQDIGYLMKTTIIWNKNQVNNRTSWGTWKSPKNPSFPTPFEYILVFCKDSYSKDGHKDNITVSRDEFIINSLAIWKFKTETNIKKFGHPAMFPVELPKRLIQQLSYKDDVVLDIFSGLGTTCVAAKMLERKWIGFELSEEYTRLSIDRLNNM